MFLSGYDTLEYSWVKATTVSVRLRILFVTLQNTNKLSGAVAGERQLHYLRTQFVVVSFSFSLILPLPPLPMEQPSFPQLSTLRGEFSEPSPTSSSSYELDPGFLAMVQKRLFSGVINDDPLDHLQEFEELCSTLVIPGMTQEVLRWKLFPFSLIRRAEQCYTLMIGSMSGDWEEL